MAKRRRRTTTQHAGAATPATVYPDRDLTMSEWLLLPEYGTDGLWASDYHRKTSYAHMFGNGPVCIDTAAKKGSTGAITLRSHTVFAGQVVVYTHIKRDLLEPATINASKALGVVVDAPNDTTVKVVWFARETVNDPLPMTVETRFLTAPDPDCFALVATAIL